MKITLLSLAVVMASSPFVLAAQNSPNQPNVDKKSFEYRFDDDLKQTPDSIARNEQWFYDAKFGAFIHFGVYLTMIVDSRTIKFS